MNYRHRLQYYLVRHARISHKEAQKAIVSGQVKVNSELVFDSVLITPYCRVELDGKMLGSVHRLQYIAYYKPVGVECTLNPDIAGNLAEALCQSGLYDTMPVDSDTQNIDKLPPLFCAGRLDKTSEGLLLLTNDGHVYNKIINPTSHLPKKYYVRLEKPYDAAFITAMEEGLEVNNRITRPARLEALSDTAFNITITEGMNRQIRRMCFSLGNYVTRLKRLSIGGIELGSLKASEYRKLEMLEIAYLQALK